VNTFRPTNAGTDGSNAVHNRTLYFPYAYGFGADPQELIG